MTSEDAILKFMETSGADWDVAKKFLDASSGKLENAINLFFQDPNMFNPAPNNPNMMPPMASMPMAQPEVRAPIDNVSYETLSGMRRGGRQAAPEPFRDYSNEWTRGGNNSDQRGLADLFSPPDYIFKGSLDEACTAAAREEKWLLVNIQSTEEFASHMLNRDIWKKQQISDIVKESFIFCQRDQNSSFARNFANLYNVWKHPSITILDPVTRACKKNMVVPEHPDANVMLAPFVHFIEKFGQPKADGSHLVVEKSKSKEKPAPKTQIPSYTPPATNKTDPDAAALAKAIAMSLADPQKQQQIQQSQKSQSSQSSQAKSTDVKSQAPTHRHPKPSPEPPASKEATRILVRCPKNPRFKRRFLKSAKLKEIYAVLEHEVDISYGDVACFVLFDARKKKTFDASMFEKTLSELELLNLALELKALR